MIPPQSMLAQTIQCFLPRVCFNNALDICSIFTQWPSWSPQWSSCVSRSWSVSLVHSESLSVVQAGRSMDSNSVERCWDRKGRAQLKYSSCHIKHYLTVGSHFLSSLLYVSKFLKKWQFRPQQNPRDWKEACALRTHLWSHSFISGT